MMNLVRADIQTSSNPERYLPGVAARLNKQYRQGIDKRADKPLQISIPFDFNTIDGFEPSMDSLFVAKKMADDANAIFPKTVQYLLLNLAVKQWLNKPRVLQVKTTEISYTMKEVYELLANDAYPPSYQLGVVFEIESCISSKNGRSISLWTSPTLVEHIFSHVTIIFIRSSPISVAEGRKGFWNTTQEFEICAGEIKKEFPNMTVGLINQVYDTPETYEDDSNGLIDFWERMNLYAAENSTPVFMVEAFDDTHFNKQSGWWKITKSPRTNGYLLQEKYQLVYNRTTFKPLPKREENPIISAWTVLTISVICGGVVIAVVAFSIYKIFQIKYRRDNIAAFVGLSEMEILAFFEGRNQLETANIEMDHLNQENDCSEIMHIFNNYTYDRSLEIEGHAFVLDDGLKLGSGAFGQVCIGRVQVDGVEKRVAVKRVNSLGTNDEALTCLRSLLSEIKVLSYLGCHDNVVALLGAHTANLEKGELFVFLELCSRGSLQKRLKGLRSADNDSGNDPYTCLNDSPNSYDVSPLAKWSLDIARGMEFLASKHVVHADLATRNVLLDSNDKAKICDFGLSRRMLNYESYVKTSQAPLPWRWMPPESLRQNVFNQRTDVWSFGVTMWEMYTLGDVPYSGINWTVDFAFRLEEGLRLPVPKQQDGHIFGNKSMYPIMQQCWETDPKKRPRFVELIAMLTEE